MISRLIKGMLIKTNYSGPYRIVEITRGCTCPLDQIEGQPTPPHIHLVLTHPVGGGKFWIGWFIEETLLSVQKTYCGYKTKPDFDRIIVMEQDRLVQMELF